MNKIQEFEVIIRHTVGEQMPRDYTVGRGVSDPGDTPDQIFNGVAELLRNVAHTLETPEIPL